MRAELHLALHSWSGSPEDVFRRMQPGELLQALHALCFMGLWAHPVVVFNDSMCMLVLNLFPSLLNKWQCY